MKLTIAGFDGEFPRMSKTMLPDNGASKASNVRLYSGELRTWNGPLFDYDTETAGLKTIFRFENPSTLAHVWLAWPTDVDVQRSSLDDTTDFRLYYTGDGTPKKTNWSMASTPDTVGHPYPGGYLEMGVPAPAVKPDVTATSGASLGPETRYYVYTYVSTFGTLKEESAPSPPSSSVDITASQSVDISNLTSPPAGAYNITQIRFYRTLPGETTGGAYVFVGEIDIEDIALGFNDDLLSTQVGEPLATALWTEPPAGLKGLTSIANGMMAGFIGNTVYFCQPYFHHAWPISYAQSVPDQIVGLGSYGTSLIVLTKNKPYILTGTDPSTMSVEQLTIPEPCITKRSIASDQYGVLYASPNGIVSIGPSTRQVISNELFRREEWSKFSPDTMIGAIYDGKYFLTFQSATEGNQTMVVSRDDKPALSFLSIRASSFFTDIQQGNLYYLNTEDDIVYQLDADDLNPLTYEWHSKRFMLPRGVTFSVVRVDVDEDQIADNSIYQELLESIKEANEAITGDTDGEVNGHEVDGFAINGSILQELPQPSSTVTSTLIIQGEKRTDYASLTIESFSPRRLPGFRSREYVIKLSGTVNVRSVTLATSMEELRG